MDLSVLANKHVTVAVYSHACNERTQDKSGKHTGDEDVHMDHLVGVSRLDFPPYTCNRYVKTLNEVLSKQ